jgi:hypothetical protein
MHALWVLDQAALVETQAYVDQPGQRRHTRPFALLGQCPNASNSCWLCAKQHPTTDHVTLLLHSVLSVSANKQTAPRAGHTLRTHIPVLHLYTQGESPTQVRCRSPAGPQTLQATTLLRSILSVSANKQTPPILCTPCPHTCIARP